MNHDDLNHWSKRAADWATDYHRDLRDRPVRADLTPGAIAAQLPAFAPDAPEPMAAIFADFERIVPGGHDALAAPTVFRVFPCQCIACVDAGRAVGQCDGLSGHAVADLARRDRD